MRSDLGPRALLNLTCECSGGNHTSELQRWVAKVTVKQDSKGMHQDGAEHPNEGATAHIPKILGAVLTAIPTTEIPSAGHSHSERLTLDSPS